MFKEKQETIAIYGGSFDPPHIGHLSVVEESIKSLEMDKLIIVPTFLNPFKTTSHLTTKERLMLSNKLFGKIAKVIVDSYEIEQGKATPTIRTIKHFQKNYRVKYFIIGADNLSSIRKWYNFDWLNSNITWVVATRAGYNLDTNALRDFKIIEVEMNISSTEIRNKETNEHR